MKIGSVDVSSVKIGSSDVSKIYIGSTEVWSAFTGLLDTYTGATAAYSLRQLSSSYSGDAIRVRRASDNTESDIGFVSNELDVASLESFCNGTNGYVTTWYDQSGNSYDATQNTASYQPQIVQNGLTIRKNGYPCIYGDGGLHRFEVTINNFPTGDINLDFFMIDHLIESGQGISSSSVGAQSYVQDRRIITTLCNEGANNAVRVYGGNSIYNENFTQYRLHNINYQSGGGAVEAIVNNEALTIQSSVTGTLNFQSASLIMLFGTYTTTLNIHESYIQEAIYYTQDKSTDRLNIMSNINSYHNVYWDGSQTSLLDSYGSSAAAYSLRALNSSYTGPLVRIRRSIDNAEQDIYAKYDGTLNVEMLEAFCNTSNNAYVTTWYDQSGNGYDATQSTASYQPLIYTNGSILTENGKPCVQFDGIDDILATTTLINPSIANPFIVSKKNNDNKYALAFNQWEAGGVRRWHFGYQGSIFGSPSTDNGLNFTLRDGIASYVTSTTTQYLNQVLLSGVTSGSSMYLYADGNLIDSDTYNGLDTNSQYIFIGGGFNGSGLLLNGNIQEAILYTSDQSSNRSGIESNINDFYNIY